MTTRAVLKAIAGPGAVPNVDPLQKNPGR